VSEIEPQLTLDGREEAIPTAPRHSPFTAAQREIMHAIADRETISSTEAGQIVHAHRSPSCARCAEGCCRFAAVDGRDALMRLQKRGLVRRRFVGVWGAR
jgi:hypothetical protein